MKKIVLALALILVGSFMLSGCSKDEILNHYNNIVQSAGSIELTGKSSLQGEKEKGIDVQDDEIGYVALHIHSALEKESVAVSMQMARAVRECISLIEAQRKIHIDVMSLSYNRLMNHIKFMVARALNKESLKVNMNDYVEHNFPQSYELARIVCDHLSKALRVQLEEIEIGYLAMHIERVSME